MVSLLLLLLQPCFPGVHDQKHYFDKFDRVVGGFDRLHFPYFSIFDVCWDGGFPGGPG